MSGFDIARLLYVETATETPSGHFLQSHASTGDFHIGVLMSACTSLLMSGGERKLSTSAFE